MIFDELLCSWLSLLLLRPWLQSGCLQSGCSLVLGKETGRLDSCLDKVFIDMENKQLFNFDLVIEEQTEVRIRFNACSSIQ